MKWIFPGVAGLLVTSAMLISSRIRKPLLVLGVLCLQAEFTTVIGDQGESSWVGGSGPSGILMPFVAVAFFMFFLYDRFVNLNRSRFEWGKAWVTIPIVLTLVTAGATVFYTPEPMRAVYWLQEPILQYLIFVVALNVAKTPEDLDFVLKLLMMNLVIQSFVYFGQVAFGVGFDLHGELTSRNAVVKRFGGTVSHNPAAFGSFLIPLLMIALSRFFLAKVPQERKRFAMMSLLGIAAVLLTFTRAVWIGFALGLACVMLLSIRRGARIRHMGLIVSAVCLGAVVVWPILALRADASQTSAAFDERYALMTMAWRVISDKPFTGVGAGAYAFVFRHYLTPDLRDKWLFVVHNEYLLRWAETGVVGLLSLIAFWIGALRIALNASRESDPTTVALGVGCTAGVIALIWEMWWDITLGFQTEALVCFLLGLLLAAVRVHKGAETLRPRRRRAIVLRASTPSMAS